MMKNKKPSSNIKEKKKRSETMGGFNMLNMIILPFILAVPAVILYFIIKLAVKNALKEFYAEKE